MAAVMPQVTKLYHKQEAHSLDFTWGVPTSVTGTKYFNVGMIHYAYAMQVSDDTQGRVTNLGSN